MSVYGFKSLPNSKYSNLLLVAAFSSNSFSGKTSSSFKNSYLPRFSDNKAEILVVYFSKSSWDLLARFCYWLFWFFHWQQFCKSFFRNFNGLSERKVALFTKTFFFSIILRNLQEIFKFILNIWFNAICWNFLLLDIFMIMCHVCSYICRNFETKLWHENKCDVEFSSSYKQFRDYRTL